MLLLGAIGLRGIERGEAILREVFQVELKHLCESYLVLLLVCQELLLL